MGLGPDFYIAPKERDSQQRPPMSSDTELR